jgi:glycosyltransferase involved in cell wall biosynthesis
MDADEERRDAAPEVAVVIPTRDRETRLAFTLEALAEQTAGLGSFEVVLVRDGDDGGWRTPEPPGVSVRTVTMSARGTPAEKRNAGWQASRARLVAFTDDDCRPAGQWLERLLVAWAQAGRPEAAVLHGPVAPDPDERQLLTGLARTLASDRDNAWFPTANLALPRDLLVRLGGFDESFRRAGGEDTDLALRALAGGAERIFSDGALVHHAVHTRTLPAALREAARADGVAALFARHPAQRRRIFARLFWKRSHATALLAAAGLVLAARGRRGAAFAALAPFVADNYDTGRPPTPKHLAATALHLPLRLAVDLAETAATVRGAVKARTPVA